MHLFVFGMGFSGRAIAAELMAKGFRISGTSRRREGVEAIKKQGFEGYLFSGTQPGAGIGDALQSATHVLMSAAPDDRGDPVLRCHRDDLARAPALKWLGYLSTVGVYGDFGGAWVDETAPLRPASKRGRARVAAEADWQAFAQEAGVPVHIFRLAGIYGPGRSPLSKLKAGTAKRIAKPGQVFNRIHVDDIAGAVAASIARPAGSGEDGARTSAIYSAIYNVADDEPAPPQDVVAFAASLLAMEPPPEVAFDDADMSQMAKSFYAENKRVSNTRLKDELDYKLRFPTFREGLRALAEQECRS